MPSLDIGCSPGWLGVYARPRAPRESPSLLEGFGLGSGLLGWSLPHCAIRFSSASYPPLCISTSLLVTLAGASGHVTVLPNLKWRGLLRSSPWFYPWFYPSDMHYPLWCEYHIYSNEHIAYACALRWFLLIFVVWYYGFAYSMLSHIVPCFILSFSFEFPPSLPVFCVSPLGSLVVMFSGACRWLVF